MKTGAMPKTSVIESSMDCQDWIKSDSDAKRRRRARGGSLVPNSVSYNECVFAAMMGMSVAPSEDANKRTVRDEDGSVCEEFEDESSVESSIPSRNSPQASPCPSPRGVSADMEREAAVAFYSGGGAVDLFSRTSCEPEMDACSRHRKSPLRANRNSASPLPSAERPASCSAITLQTSQLFFKSDSSIHLPASPASRIVC